MMDWIIFILPALMGVVAMLYFVHRGVELTDDKWDNQ